MEREIASRSARVTDFGWDRYVVERSNGAETIYLLVENSEMIISAYRHPVSG